MRALIEAGPRRAQRRAVGERSLVRRACESRTRELAAQAQVRSRQRVGAPRPCTPPDVPGDDREPAEEGEHEGPAELARIGVMDAEPLEDIELNRVVELH